MNWVAFCNNIIYSMLDNLVVDQTYLKVLPTETWDLCPLYFTNFANQGQVSGMCVCVYIYIYIYIYTHTCNRCIYKTASKFCIAIVYFPVLHQGSILCIFTFL